MPRLPLREKSVSSGVVRLQKRSQLLPLKRSAQNTLRARYGVQMLSLAGHESTRKGHPNKQTGLDQSASRNEILFHAN
jgi:hypothetical protein